MNPGFSHGSIVEYPQYHNHIVKIASIRFETLEAGYTWHITQSEIFNSEQQSHQKKHYTSKIPFVKIS